MKISKVLYSSIPCVFSLTSSPFAYYANATEDTLINESKGVEIYQPSGINKADKSFDINEESATISSGTGEFSISPTENEITRNFLRSEHSDNMFKVTQTNENELLIKNVLNYKDVNNGVLRVSYNIDLPYGGSINFTSDTKGNHESSVVVYDSNNLPIGGFFGLEAETNNGDKRKSWFTIEDNKLMQNIANPNEDSKVPVNVIMRAAGLDYWHFYKDSTWIKRGVGRYALALSVNTTTYAQWDDFPEIGWNVLADRHRNDGIYLQGQFRPYFQGNENGMYNQWKCHYLTVGHFKTWNLEPCRPNPSLKGTMAAKCNSVW